MNILILIIYYLINYKIHHTLNTLQQYLEYDYFKTVIILLN